MDDSRIGPYSTAPRGALGWVRDATVLAVGWTALALALTLSTAFALLTLRIGSSRYLHHVAHWLGGIVLGISGIRVRVRNPERLKGRRLRIVAINHSSQLDLWVGATLLPPEGTAVAKKEFLRIPFLGWMFFAFKVPTLDRSNPEKARRSMARVAEQMRARQATIFIAPEGTRSRDGRLGPFKMGTFHLAAATDAPILPAILRGAKECQPMGALVPRRGVVEVDLLPEIPFADLGGPDLHAARDALRAIFVQALEAGAKTPAG